MRGKRKYHKYLIIVGLLLTTSGCRWELWGKVAGCESHHNWQINAYHDGGLQFHPTTWVNYGGREFAAYAYQAEPWEQMIVAERVLEKEGWGAWPTCSRKLGLR